MSTREDDVERIIAFGMKLHNYRKETIHVAKSLLDHAFEFQESFQDVKKATIASSSTGLLGGILAAVGFGLSFATFGASLILSAVGTGIGALSGFTSGGAAIGEYFKRRKAVQKAKQLIEKCEHSRKELITECKEITEKLTLHNIETQFPGWTKFIAKLVGGALNITWSVAWKTIINAVSSVKLADTAADIALASSATTNITVASVRATSTFTSTAHIAGGVAGILFIPVYIGSFVHSVHAVATGKQSDTTKEIKRLADQLLQQCPSEDEINNTILDTIGKIDKLISQDEVLYRIDQSILEDSVCAANFKDHLPILCELKTYQIEEDNSEY